MDTAEEIARQSARATVEALLAGRGHGSDAIADIVQSLKPDAFVVEGRVDGIKIETFVSMVANPDHGPESTAVASPHTSSVDWAR